VTVDLSFDPAWEETHRSRQWGAMYDPRLITCVWRRYGFVPDRSALRFLDIGCGVGAQTMEIGRLGFAVLGIDGSPSAISRAREAMPEILRHHVAFAVGDVTGIRLPNDHIDCVTDVACLEVLRLDHAKAALQEIVRVLKPDGTMFSIHKADGWQHRAAAFKVGCGSRGLSYEDAKNFYSAFFSRVELSRDVHVDAIGQTVPEWIVACAEPRK
jgi:ubiquinone/menaquinone biosynthesis C-methylase UbiE